MNASQRSYIKKRVNEIYESKNQELKKSAPSLYFDIDIDDVAVDLVKAGKGTLLRHKITKEYKYCFNDFFKFGPEINLKEILETRRSEWESAKTKHREAVVSLKKHFENTLDILMFGEDSEILSTVRALTNLDVQEFLK